MCEAITMNPFLSPAMTDASPRRLLPQRWAKLRWWQWLLLIVSAVCLMGALREFFLAESARYHVRQHWLPTELVTPELITAHPLKGLAWGVASVCFACSATRSTR